MEKESESIRIAVIEPFDVLFDTEPSLLVNEEYLYNGTDPNRAIYVNEHMVQAGYLSPLADYKRMVKAGELFNIVNGTFIAIGLDYETGKERSVTDEEFQKVTQAFGTIESLFSGRNEAFALLEAKEFKSSKRHSPFSLAPSGHGWDGEADELREVHRLFEAQGFTLSPPIATEEGYLFEFVGTTPQGHEVPHYQLVHPHAFYARTLMAEYIEIEIFNFEELLSMVEGQIAADDWADLNGYCETGLKGLWVALSAGAPTSPIGNVGGDGSIGGEGDFGGRPQSQDQRESMSPFNELQTLQCESQQCDNWTFGRPGGLSL